MEKLKAKLMEAFPRAERAVIARIGNYAEQRLSGPVVIESTGIDGQGYELRVIHSDGTKKREIHYESPTGVISYKEQTMSEETVLSVETLEQVESP